MNKTILWDLLGTLGGDSHSLIHQDFEFFTEAIPALKKATKNGYLNIIITNQSHISHGRITEEEYSDALERILNHLNEKNVEVSQVYTCPHARKDKCDCKKPQPKLGLQAMTDFNLNLEETYVVGDSGKNDMMLAHNLGAKSVLVLTGTGEFSLKEDRNAWSETDPTFIANNCLDAINYIVGSLD